MKRVVVVDNYDSFTYNLVQYVMSLGVDCDVRLNDRTTSAEIGADAPAGTLAARFIVGKLQIRLSAQHRSVLARDARRAATYTKALARYGRSPARK